MAAASRGEPEVAFERLGSRYASVPIVSQGTGFGSSPGLRVRGRIFAMLIGDELVVKLPRKRVDQLVSAGRGARFDPGHGRVMKEWLTVPLSDAAEWEQLTADAFAYVAGLPQARSSPVEPA